MTRIVFSLGLAAGLAVPLGAQTTALPDTYSFVAATTLLGPGSTIKVNRNGSKELIEEIGSPSSPDPLHIRILYDFQAHRLYTTDSKSGTCSTQVYTSPNVSTIMDPIGGAAEMLKDMAKTPPKTLGTEVVNGIRTKIIEAGSAKEGARVWLDEKLNFAVKINYLMEGKTIPAFEMRQLAWAPSPASLFATPSGCQQIEGETNANGGHAEMSVDVKVPAQTRQLGSGTQPASDAGPDPVLGKWEVTGKDSLGAVWRGTLTITIPNPDQFSPNPAEYNHFCDIDLESATKGGRGRGTTCLYNPRTRTLSFSSGTPMSKYSYTAVLAPDGRTLQGRWDEGKDGTGTWTARSGSATPAAVAPAAATAGPAPRIAPAGPAKVTSVRLRVVPGNYKGPCPAKVQLIGDITTDGPGTVWYNFLAGAVRKNSPDEGTVTFRAAGTQSVTLNAEYVMTPQVGTLLLASIQDAQGNHGPQNESSGEVSFNAACTAPVRK